MARGFSSKVVMLGAVVFIAIGVTTFVALARWHQEDPPVKPVAPATPISTASPGAAAKPEAQPAGEPEYTKVALDGKTFKLELSLDDQRRFKGLSGRTEIPADGGMLFVFPRPAPLYFVMRDCPIPIDIIFLDASGRITAFHKMKIEDPRGPDEQDTPTQPCRSYEDRLKRYSSKYDAQYVIELKGDTLDGLKLKEGQQIKIDSGLKARAR